MRKATLIILFWLQAFYTFAQTNVVTGPLIIEVNYNIELLGLAYFIAFEGVNIENDSLQINGRKIAKKEWHKYGYYINERYKKHTGSKNLAKSFSVADHLWLDYIIALLIQLDDFPQAKLTDDIDLKYYLNFSLKKDSSEARQNTIIFLEGLNGFYDEINFKQYIIDTKSYYASALNQIKTNLPKNNFIPAMEQFYNKRFDTYALVPSLTIPRGMGFGLHYTKKGVSKIFNAFGALDTQRFENTQQPDLGFGSPLRLQELSIHEFGHSFGNPVIDELPDEKIAKTEGLFQPIKPAMTDQNYKEWKACLYEHFVRAGEVMIARLIGEKAGSEKLLSHYIDNRSFIYLPTILAELENFQGKQITYYEAVLRAMDALIKLK